MAGVGRGEIKVRAQYEGSAHVRCRNAQLLRPGACPVGLPQCAPVSIVRAEVSKTSEMNEPGSGGRSARIDILEQHRIERFEMDVLVQIKVECGERVGAVAAVERVGHAIL